MLGFGLFLLKYPFFFLLEQNCHTHVVAGHVFVSKAEGAGRGAGQRVPGRATTSGLGPACLSEKLSSAK